MARKHGFGPAHARVHAVLAALALLALLAGCVTVPATVAPAATTATTAVTSEPVATNTAATAPTTQPTEELTATATAALAATETLPPTAAATQAVTPTVSTAGIVVQKADRSIQAVDVAGNAKPLYQAADQVDMAAIFPPSNTVSNTLYLPLSGASTTLVKVDATGGTLLPSITGQVYGLAAQGDKLAYSVADLSGNPIKSEIRVGGLDGTQATTVYSQTATTAPTVLRVMRWAPDGKLLYFGKEPVGLGGYILFGGLTNIWVLDVETGQATELVPPRAQNAAVCIDDLSPDGSMAADHCNPQAMELIGVTSGTTRTVQLPPEVPLFGTTGGARFSPDGKTLAFALARRNPDDEQGWVAVADVAAGTSKVIATSPAKDYFSVVGFLDANTLILQSGGQVAGVWTVGVDGQNLKRFTDGVFVGTLSAQR